ncbi:MAG: hypothetical protein ABW128_11720, partial [Rhizorhabdus sp.]
MGEGVDELNDAPARQRRFASWSRRRRIALGAALVVLVALIGLWVERKPIASRVIDGELARRGVVARYDVRDLGFGRQRLTNVVIGDPRDPDLVADWLETRTRIGFGGASLDAVRAGHVRLRGRIIDGRLSLGEIDKLIPPSSGKAFALPALDVDIADARMRLETPLGVAGLRIAGRGRLDGGFAGTAAVVSDRLAQGDCGADGLRAAIRVAVTAGAPRLRGPVQVAAGRCAGVDVRRGGADIDVVLTPALDGWRGSARLASGPVRGAGARVAGLRGNVTFDGAAQATGGTADLTASNVAIAGASAGTLGIAGRYRIGAAQAFAGTVRVADARIAADRLPAIGAATGAGTPAAPLIAAVSQAVRGAANGFRGSAALAVRQSGGAGHARITAASLQSVSGARLRIAGGTGLTFGWPGTRLRIDTRLAMAGGGLPDAQVALAQARAGAPITSRATIAPYAAGGARLALAPVVFTATPGGATRIATRVALSGPLGDGRVDGLALPVDLRWNGRGTLVANPACTPVAIQRLAVAGLVLDPLRTTLCPIAGAMVTLADGRLAGGARLPAVRLAGRLGQTPLTVAASGAQLRLGDGGFVLDSVAARLGSPERITRIDLAQLTGRIAGGGVAGTFGGGAGQIANVPLLLGAAAGDWSLRGGALRLTATMTVDDAAPDPRFRTLAARDVTLDLVNGAIAARGTLYEPTKNVKVADVA